MTDDEAEPLYASTIFAEEYDIVDCAGASNVEPILIPQVYGADGKSDVTDLSICSNREAKRTKKHDQRQDLRRILKIHSR